MCRTKYPAPPTSRLLVQHILLKTAGNTLVRAAKTKMDHIPCRLGLQNLTAIRRPGPFHSRVVHTSLKIVTALSPISPSHPSRVRAATQAFRRQSIPKADVCFAKSLYPEEEAATFTTMALFAPKLWMVTRSIRNGVSPKLGNHGSVLPKHVRLVGSRKSNATQARRVAFNAKRLGPSVDLKRCKSATLNPTTVVACDRRLTVSEARVAVDGRQARTLVRNHLHSPTRLLIPHYLPTETRRRPSNCQMPHARFQVPSHP